MISRVRKGRVWTREIRLVPDGGRGHRGALASRPHPYSLIGLDLDDGTLFPDQGEISGAGGLRAESRGLPEIPKGQLDALKLAGVEYTVLEGTYTRAEIREIYRRTSIYFLASAESFGLPICELQACGAKIFLPDAYWAASHWLGEDLYTEREPQLSPNFVIYEDDADKLARRIDEVVLPTIPRKLVRL